MSTSPTILGFRKGRGIAGQYYVTVELQYPDESPCLVTFVGSTYGGRVVMVTPDGAQVMVDRAVMERCGSLLSESWVRRFFGQEGPEDFTLA